MTSKDSTDEEIIDILLPIEDLRRENADLHAENERLRGILGEMADLPTWAEEMGELQRENERLRAALDTVGPRLEAHHAAMAAGDLMPCTVCGDAEDDGTE